MYSIEYFILFIYSKIIYNKYVWYSKYIVIINIKYLNLNIM